MGFGGLSWDPQLGNLRNLRNPLYPKVGPYMLSGVRLLRDPVMSRVNVIISLGCSNFPENVKSGCPTISMENSTVLGVPKLFIQWTSLSVNTKGDLRILGKLTVPQGTQ